MSVNERNSLYVSTYSKEGMFAQNGAGTPSSGVWVTAQRALYQAIRLPAPGTVRKLYWLNGAVVGTDTMQMGLYLPDGTDGAPGTRIINGSAITTAGANVCQYDDIADVALPPGTYWLAQLSSGVTTTVFRFNFGGIGRALGIYAQLGLASLPATATPVQSSNGYYPVAGLVMRASP